MHILYFINKIITLNVNCIFSVVYHHSVASNGQSSRYVQSISAAASFRYRTITVIFISFGGTLFTGFSIRRYYSSMPFPPSQSRSSPFAPLACPSSLVLSSDNDVYTIMVKKKKKNCIVFYFSPRASPKKAERQDGKMSDLNYNIQGMEICENACVVLKMLYTVIPLQFYLRNLTFLNVLIKIALGY